MSDRLYFADNLRTWLIMLVVLPYLAIVYGTGFIFYYVGLAYDHLLAYAGLPFLSPSTRPTL